MHPLQESWDRTAAHLSTARDMLALDAATLGEVNECLSHNELGLTLDVLVDVGEAAGDAAPVAFWHSMRGAVEEMGISSDDPAHGTSVCRVLRH